MNVNTPQIVKKRNPWAVLGLGVITLGIYWLVWWYRINDELRHAGTDRDPIVAVLAWTVGVLLLVPPFVSTYKATKALRQLQMRLNIVHRASPALVLCGLLLGLGLLVPTYLQYQLNHLAE